MKISELLEKCDQTFATFDGDPANKLFAKRLLHVVMANVADFRDELQFDMTHNEIMNRAFPGLYETPEGANDNDAKKAAA